eukprot:TRINITY_DN13107_c0_g1_i1.p1 TRINITY_DN13107_c0_g1~~TRINITY_DN13107_c0_g1_i1.p1  ORF type:complete len:103 (-),score=20.22 TRINITY_DN13107_c0_g1_i1:32-340(-)
MCIRDRTEIQGSFLGGCTALTSLDLTPLSQVKIIENSFLRECRGLTAIDLSPLSQVTDIEESFLEGCTGLVTVDLTPMALLQVVPADLMSEPTVVLPQHHRR